MPPTPAEGSVLRSAAVINEEIRRIVRDGHAGTVEHERLLAEWVEAQRRETTTNVA